MAMFQVIIIACQLYAIAPCVVSVSLNEITNAAACAKQLTWQQKTVRDRWPHYGEVRGYCRTLQPPVRS